MYSMFLIANGKEIPIPVLPEVVTIDSPSTNETVEVLELGEVLLLKKKGLRNITWESFFPLHSAPYVSGDMIDPVEAIKALQKARDEKKPIRFLITGTDLDVNMRVGIDSLSYDERYGETGDIHYSLTLKEWKEYGPKKLNLPSEDSATQTITKQDPPRAGGPDNKKGAYTVKSGDCLWAIAKAHYGSGEQWPKIYEANKGVVGSNPNLIYPNQKLVLP